MKYLKLFEKIKEPQVGDYVICKEPHIKPVRFFIENNIGKITSIDDEYWTPHKLTYGKTYELLAGRSI